MNEEKRDAHDREAEPYEYLVIIGALRELEARAKWLGEVARELDSQRAKSESTSSRGIGRLKRKP